MAKQKGWKKFLFSPVPASGLVLGILLSLTLFVAGAYAYVQTVAEKASINAIAAMPRQMPPVLNDKCQEMNVATFAVKDPCGRGAYATMTFNCRTGVAGAIKRPTQSCETVSALYAQAQQACNVACRKPSPFPSPVPSPMTSCRPRPACLDSNPRCLLPVTSDMCPPSAK